jgi:uncharacterized coiled-coil protein SlyX
MNDMAIGAIVTAIFGGIVLVIRELQKNYQEKLNLLHKNTREKQTAQFTEQGIIIDRQEKQIARLEAQILEQQKAISSIQKMHAECREASAEQRMYIILLYEYAKRLHAMVKRDHPDMEPPPDLPPARKWHDEVNFMANTTEQNTKLAIAVDTKLRGANGAA